MNKLECQVSSCQHWSNNLCCLDGIQVDGPAARENSQTCCDSYEERRSGSGENSSTGSSSPSVDSDIGCSAEHCAYNHNCKCEAECVCVGCCCNDVSSKSGTECCTFRAE